MSLPLKSPPNTPAPVTGSPQQGSQPPAGGQLKDLSRSNIGASLPDDIPQKNNCILLADAAAQALEEARETQAQLMVQSDLSMLPLWFGVQSRDKMKARKWMEHVLVLV